MRGLEASNELLLGRRLASLEASHESRRHRISDELLGATEPRIIRMKTSELSRVQADFEQRRGALERARRVEVLSLRVAAGIVEVTGVR